MKNWPTIRALLLSAALIIGLIDGCPVPSDQNLEQWPRALVPWGLRLRATRDFLVTPFDWLGNGLAIHQRWTLFSVADPSRFRLWVEAREGEKPWQLLFRAHDPAHAYRADTIEYRRLRGAWNTYKRGPNAGYAPFADFIARTIFLDPSLKFDRVRVRLERVRGF